MAVGHGARRDEPGCSRTHHDEAHAMTVPPPVSRTIDAAMEASVVLSFSRIGYEVRRRLDRWTDLADLPGTGRRVLVTGANSGLGYAAVTYLLQAGADVLFTVRSEEKGDDTLTRLRDELGTEVAARASYDVLDLGDLSSVRAFAERRLDESGDAGRIDGLVHNAGAMFEERGLTDDGLERTYQLHVVGPFLLTALLLPRLAEEPAGRVVTVTSGGMYAEKLDADQVDSPDGYRPAVAYARAKRAQVALTRAWARRFGSTGIAFHVAHPGWALTPGVETSLPGFRKLTGPILRDPAQGADTVAYLTLADDLPGAGRLWHDRRPRSEHKVPWTRTDDDAIEAMWERVSADADVTPSL
jgi:dehydrogenase/reductase SDR family protein 12